MHLKPTIAAAPTIAEAAAHESTRNDSIAGLQALLAVGSDLDGLIGAAIAFGITPGDALGFFQGTRHGRSSVLLADVAIALALGGKESVGMVPLTQLVKDVGGEPWDNKAGRLGIPRLAPWLSGTALSIFGPGGSWWQNSLSTACPDVGSIPESLVEIIQANSSEAGPVLEDPIPALRQFSDSLATDDERRLFAEWAALVTTTTPIRQVVGDLVHTKRSDILAWAYWTLGCARGAQMDAARVLHWMEGFQVTGEPSTSSSALSEWGVDRAGWSHMAAATNNRMAASVTQDRLAWQGNFVALLGGLQMCAKANPSMAGHVAGFIGESCKALCTIDRKTTQPIWPELCRFVISLAAVSSAAAQHLVPSFLRFGVSLNALDDTRFVSAFLGAARSLPCDGHWDIRDVSRCSLAALNVSDRVAWEGMLVDARNVKCM